MSKLFPTIVVEIAKLTDYCLNETHPVGKHKARIFRARLGLTISEAIFLQRALVSAAETLQAQLHTGELDQYGQRYVLDFAMTTPAGTATIRSAWIVLTGETILRLTTCYVQ